MHDYLKKIIAHKRIEVDQLKADLQNNQQHPIYAYLNDRQLDRKLTSFRKAISNSASIIAEIKRKSPSKNQLADIPDPVNLAMTYANAGASAISVLTDAYGFDGSLQDLQAVSDALLDKDIAVLRKDFMIDPVQIAESIVSGADAILLIVAVLKERTAMMLDTAQSLGVDAIIEVHDKNELDYAVSIGADIVGINNRDLTTFEVDANRALELLPFIPDHVITVAESGMSSPELAANYISAGFNAVLVGEALVRSSDPAQFIQQFRALS